MGEKRIWGIWNADARFWWDDQNMNMWSFDRDNLEPFMAASNGSEIREMSDEDVAEIPEAAAALLAYLRIQEVRERLAQIRVTHERHTWAARLGGLFAMIEGLP